jgi:TetR/AcrR family transcriptional regulator, cholesterol catabolism regulator
VESIKHQITEKALAAFAHVGFKAVTVNEIAQMNGISKKTLYEQFSDKNAIVNSAVALFDKQIRNEQDVLIKNSSNAIEEVIQIMRLLENKLQKMNVNCFHDLPKYYPQALLSFKAHQQTHLHTILNNIRRGVKEGLYRKNVNTELVATLRMETMFYFLMNKTEMDKFGFVEMQLHQMQLFLYSICTVKGHELIDKHIALLKKKTK